MPRATSPRTRKTRSNHEENHGNGQTAVITPPANLDEEIRARAYQLYEEAGRQEGRDQEYWLRAESEILERHGVRRA
jgi:hypothetical protein